MVKKRFPKKYVKISSSDESDSDDFYEEEPAESKPKKYSLRQRRSANFAEDFDYDMLEEADEQSVIGVKALRSDDDDFDLTTAQEVEYKTNTEAGIKSVSKNINLEKSGIPNCTITKYKEREMEPAIPQHKQSSDDMIDFEDVIRADILVNKSRIDYDSIIEKTEIKIEKINPEEKETKPDNGKIEKSSLKLKKNGELPKKRGRKPKKTNVEEDDDIYVDRKYKKQKFVEEPHQSYTHETTGLPINTVLGVTESLYELAERYHLQGGIMEEEIQPLPIESLLNENNPTEHSKNTSHGGDEVSLNQSESVSGVIEIY